MDKELVQWQLSKGVLRLRFTKKDGTLRTMYATTYDILIPESQKPKGDNDRTYSDEVHRVFDTEINEWRSFRWDSLQQVDTVADERLL